MEIAIQRYVDDLLNRIQANKLPALTEKGFNYLSQGSLRYCPGFYK
ncbi:hypothetical protein [Bacillus stratosphericus]|nr:hypothetical protein [Bacillus stratosphericus]